MQTFPIDLTEIIIQSIIPLHRLLTQTKYCSECKSCENIKHCQICKFDPHHYKSNKKDHSYCKDCKTCHIKNLTFCKDCNKCIPGSLLKQNIIHCEAKECSNDPHHIVHDGSNVYCKKCNHCHLSKMFFCEKCNLCFNIRILNPNHCEAPECKFDAHHLNRLINNIGAKKDDYWCKVCKIHWSYESEHNNVFCNIEEIINNEITDIVKINNIKNDKTQRKIEKKNEK